MEPASAPRRPWIRLGLSLAIGAGLAWMLSAGGLPLLPDARALSRLEPWAIGAYALALTAVHLLRAVRWRHLLRPLAEVPARTVLATAWLGFAAVLFFPLRTGEVVRPLLLARKSRVRGWEATGTVGAERVIDGLVLSLLLLGALALTSPIEPPPERVGDLPVPVAAVPGAAYTALALFLAVFALMALFYAKRAVGVRLVEATLGLLSRRLALAVAEVVDRVAMGLRFLPAPRRVLPFLLETGGYWIVNATGFWLLARGCGLEGIGVLEAYVVMGCLGLGMLAPSAPGYFGTFQLSIYLALAMFVPAERVLVEGSLFVFVAYTGQLAQHVLGAAAGVALDRPGPVEKLAESGPIA